MPVAEDVHRDAACEVEILLALLTVEIRPLTADRANRRAWINGHERRDGHEGSLFAAVKSGSAAIASAPKKGKVERGPRHPEQQKGRPDYPERPSLRTTNAI